MSIPSSQSGKDHIVLTQSISAHAISDPGVSLPTHTNPRLTPTHSRRASVSEILKIIGSIQSSAKITQTTKHVKDA